VVSWLFARSLIFSFMHVWCAGASESLTAGMCVYCVYMAMRSRADLFGAEPELDEVLVTETIEQTKRVKESRSGRSQWLPSVTFPSVNPECAV